MDVSMKKLSYNKFIKISLKYKKPKISNIRIGNYQYFKDIKIVVKIYFFLEFLIILYFEDDYFFNLYKTIKNLL
jgi:hypothetical protein